MINGGEANVNWIASYAAMTLFGWVSPSPTLGIIAAYAAVAAFLLYQAGLAAFWTLAQALSFEAGRNTRAFGRAFFQREASRHGHNLGFRLVLV